MSRDDGEHRPTASIDLTGFKNLSGLTPNRIHIQPMRSALSNQLSTQTAEIINPHSTHP